MSVLRTQIRAMKTPIVLIQTDSIHARVVKDTLVMGESVKVLIFLVFVYMGL